MEAGVVPIAISVPSSPQPVQVIRFSPNSDRLAIGTKDAVVRIYDLTVRGVSDEPVILRGHQLGITQIAFAPSGRWIATGSQDNTVRLWNLASSKFSPESAVLYGHLGWISALTIDSSGEYIYSGSYDRTIRIWNVKRDRIGSALNEEPIALATSLGIPESLLITRDGDKMVVLGNEGSLGIYHLPSLRGESPEDPHRSVTFRNSRLSITQSLMTLDNQILIFSYEHLLNPLNSGIRLWSLQAQAFVQ
jgi:WD40 repeat protein